MKILTLRVGTLVRAFLVPLALAAPLMAAPSPRAIVNLDFDWRFLAQDTAGGEAAAFDDAAWRRVDVPHDWSIEGEYSSQNTPQNGWLPAGTGWYRRVIDVPAEWLDGVVGVRFEGVYMNSQVWLNGAPVGGRPYGFMTFSCDLTGKLQPGRNVLAVRVDNTPAPTARFYHGSGIYGHVDLLVLPRAHIVPDGGVFARTITADAQRAELAVSTEVRNTAATELRATIAHRLLDERGVAAVEWPAKALTIAAGQVATSEVTGAVNRPRLWSPESPTLYTLETTLRDGDRVLDVARTTIGLRTIRWEGATGFWLNGRNVKLHGVCEHLEMMPAGAGVPDALIERRLRQLQAMGVNAIRTAHNPFTPAFYDLCDRLGLLVMDEIFDGWHRKDANDYGGRFFDEWWKRDTVGWIRRDRNHPSIVIYSIGNETGRVDINNVTGLIHEHDTTRPTTGGMITEGVDVLGYNGPGEITATLTKMHAERPDRAIVLTEVPHTLQTRGFYRALSWWRDQGAPREEYPAYATEEVFTSGGNPRYLSSYDNATVRITARQSLRRTRDTAWIAGEFRWTGYECFGETQFMGAEFPKRSYNCGVIDLAGFPKDLFYLYQSQWTQAPMVHLLPHWTHAGLEGKTIPVVAYSNCDEVELFLNGRSLGRKAPSDLLDFVWNVPYAAGELKAVGYRQGREVATTRFRTAGQPAHLHLTTDNAALHADRRDVSLVTFAIEDDKGEMIPWAHDRVEFRTIGPVHPLGYENGDPMDCTAPRAAWRKAFYGLGRGYYQATAEDGPVEVTAAALLGNRTFQQSTTVAIDVARVALRGALASTQFEIFYTTDGSAPTPASPRYAAPFSVNRDTTVRALVRRDSREFLTLSDRFQPGKPPMWSDPRYETPKNADGPFKGPFDRELLGQWKSAGGVFELRADGTICRVDGRNVGQVGWWWYDYPEDKFEGGHGTGTGELRWFGSVAEPMHLTSLDAKAFIVTDRGTAVRFEKVTTPAP